jgi:small ligand-binding sensory domain FIST
MKWSTALSQKLDLEQALQECCAKLNKELDGQDPDLLMAFIAPEFMAKYDLVPGIIYGAMSPKTFIGCSAAGFIGGGMEVEQNPAVSMVAARLPDVAVKGFHLTDAQMPDLDDAPENWHKLINVAPPLQPDFILLSDPFSFRIDILVQGLDFAFPKAVKIGGLSSGANEPGINAMFLNDKVYKEGMVGVALSGNLVIDTIVAQGCRPIGRPLHVTKCNKNFLYELDGEPAVNVLHGLLMGLAPHDQELARHSLFLGVVMDEFKDNFKPGDFLIRNILGLEQNSGALVIGEILRPERTIQFHLRDAATSSEDLRMLLRNFKDRHSSNNKNASGALLFSCLGRGQYLYGEPNHDSHCFFEHMGEIPLGGFFCNGEIGPVGGTTFLHGYTSSFGIFSTKTEGSAV